MANQLLIRAYNVGCGDCIYVRIPDDHDGFHILIDCGKKGDDQLLQAAMKHLAGQLPKGSKPNKTRLDLLVATHRHEDHIKGFDPKLFADIEVKNIWMSAAMDPKHPQAQKVNSLRAFATKTMRELVDSGRPLGPAIEVLASLYGVSNDAADTLLMDTLPKANGITPRYMHNGMSHDLALPDDTDITILAPEQDIDHFYLGEELDATLSNMHALSSALTPRTGSGPVAAAVQPPNISETDFRVLQSRMLSNGLAFAAKESSIQNNLSVVLLIEWRKRRLLFVGDAEWDGEFRDGKHNGSWNVMWDKHRTTHLKAPLDFLKVGHHGSINATPPPASEQGSKTPVANGIYTVLDTILPVPPAGTKPTAQAIVSTEREFYDPIPECKLLVDLATRVANTRSYGADLKAKGIDAASIWVSAKAKKNRFFETYEKAFLDQPQPRRTDLEFVLDARPFIEVEIPPASP